MKIKVCGLRDAENILAVTELKPDYIGFIFYEKSPRYFKGELPEIPETINKVGVFVDAPLGLILEKVEKHRLNVVQLHGSENPGQIGLMRELLPAAVDIWKVFSVGEHFKFKKLNAFVELVDAFLFDTKGENPGGNGVTFDWTLLNNYPLETPIIVSGGIGKQELPAVKALLQSELPILAIDVNSRFETAPGLKNIEDLKILFDYEL